MRPPHTGPGRKGARGRQQGHRQRTCKQKDGELPIRIEGIIIYVVHRSQPKSGSIGRIRSIRSIRPIMLIRSIVSMSTIPSITPLGRLAQLGL